MLSDECDGNYKINNITEYRNVTVVKQKYPEVAVNAAYDAE